MLAIKPGDMPKIYQAMEITNSKGTDAAKKVPRGGRLDRQGGQGAAFNVLACNRDDHARNFAFLMDSKGEWTLSPAFDLTPSEGMAGHHTTSLLGEALNPTRNHLLDLGRSMSLEGVPEMLAKVERAVRAFPKIAREVGVAAPTVKKVEKRLAEVRLAYEAKKLAKSRTR